MSLSVCVLRASRRGYPIASCPAKVRPAERRSPGLRRELGASGPRAVPAPPNPDDYLPGAWAMPIPKAAASFEENSVKAVRAILS